MIESYRESPSFSTRREASRTAAKVFLSRSDHDFAGETPTMLARTLDRMVAGLLPARDGKKTADTTEFHDNLARLCGVATEQLAEYAMLPVQAIAGAGIMSGFHRLCALAAPVAAIVRRTAMNGIPQAVSREEAKLGRSVTARERDCLRDLLQTRSKTIAVELVTTDITLLTDWTRLWAPLEKLLNRPTGDVHSGPKISHPDFTREEEDLIRERLHALSLKVLCHGRFEAAVARKYRLETPEAHDVIADALARSSFLRLALRQEVSEAHLWKSIEFAYKDSIAKNREITAGDPTELAALGGRHVSATNQEESHTVEIAATFGQWLHSYATASADVCKRARAAAHAQSRTNTQATRAGTSPCRMEHIRDGKCTNPDACLTAHCYLELSSVVSHETLDAMAGRLARGTLKKHLAGVLHARTGITMVHARRVADQALAALTIGDLLDL